MKLTRIILVCTLLLLAASPMFAAPPCKTCVEEGGSACDFDPGSGTRCRFVAGACETYGGYCINFAETTILAEWSVASIEMTRPDTKTVTTPTAVASAATTQPNSQQ
ncbi:MAG TPA: hypothetical protein VGQ76_18740 [Thermoanaerobaculia bacterium]|nr:hypothetical protein [Thermoanaerobaculia bacterium]